LFRQADTKIYQGRIEISGNHRDRVKQWLSSLGF
jgi:translation initiation factor 1 (eIF-1/SUI1)